MSASKPGYSQQVRDTANQLIERMRNDSSFVDQLKANPTGTLTAAGLPQNAVGDFMHEAGIPAEGEVGGYMMCSETCISESVRCGPNTGPFMPSGRMC